MPTCVRPGPTRPNASPNGRRGPLAPRRAGAASWRGAPWPPPRSAVAPVTHRCCKPRSRPTPQCVRLLRAPAAAAARLCCDGYTEFCCTHHRRATPCPPGACSAAGGRSTARASAAEARPGTTWTATRTCGVVWLRRQRPLHGRLCSGTQLRVRQRVAAATARPGARGFRYGQLPLRTIACLGPIVCRVVTCIAPVDRLDATCTTTHRGSTTPRRPTTGPASPATRTAASTR